MEEETRGDKWRGGLTDLLGTRGCRREGNWLDLTVCLDSLCL